MEAPFPLVARALAQAIRQTIKEQDARAFAWLCSQNIEVILEALDQAGRKDLH
jgi:hypothetical protein